jgi:hypothetical protein
MQPRAVARAPLGRVRDARPACSQPRGPADGRLAHPRARQARGTMILPSLRRTPETASVKECAALPWGMVLQPLAPTSGMDTDRSLTAIGAEEVPRCAECFGYISAYCLFERKAWLCCLCGTKNDLPNRYASSAARAGLEEMQR